MCAATSEDEHAVSTLATGPCSPKEKPMRPLAALCDAPVNAKPPAPRLLLESEQDSHFMHKGSPADATYRSAAAGYWALAEGAVHRTRMHAVLTTQRIIVA